MKAYVQLEEICVCVWQKESEPEQRKARQRNQENVAGDHYWDFSLPVFDIPNLTNYAHVLNMQQLPNLMQSPPLAISISYFLGL